MSSHPLSPHPDYPGLAGARIAVISTPRSGNTWVREMLARLSGLPQLAVHSLADNDWPRLPARCVLQLHWRRDPAFVERLRCAGFRVVTVARHPLDVLISVLHFAHHSDTADWLRGEGGDEQPLAGLTPRSRPFYDYAAGPRAAALLAVTPDWWGRPGVVSLRYEDLVADPAGELARAAAELALAPAAPVAGVLEETTLRRLGRASTNHHFWVGRPGLWRELIPAAEARDLAAAVASPLSALGYDAGPVPDLTPGRADANWNLYFGRELVAALRRSSETHRAQLRAAEEALAAADADRARLREEVWASRTEAGQLRERLHAVEGLGRSSLAVARGLQRVVDHLPGLIRPGERDR
jgi:hypothetical protein